MNNPNARKLGFLAARIVAIWILGLVVLQLSSMVDLGAIVGAVGLVIVAMVGLFLALVFSPLGDTAVGRALATRVPVISAFFSRGIVAGLRALLDLIAGALMWTATGRWRGQVGMPVPRQAQYPGVYLNPVLLVRTPGAPPQVRWWPTDGSAGPPLLAESVNALVLAYDTLLLGARGDADLSAYHSLNVRAAWTDPSYFGLVLQVNPGPALMRATALPRSGLIRLIAARSSWSEADLEKGLNLSDSRLFDDPRRAGLAGQYITFDLARAGAPARAEAVRVSGDATEQAIQRGLREMGLPATLFTRVGAPARGWDEKGVYREFDTYRTKPEPETVEGYAERAKNWGAMATALHFHAGVPADDISLAYNATTKIYRYARRIPAPAFPGDESGDNRTELSRYLASNKLPEAPLAYVAGLDQRGVPVVLDLDEAPHLLVIGATKSGKSYSGAISPLLQLAHKNDPADLAYWLCDPKHELRLFLGALPHTRRIIHPHDVAGAMSVMADFAAEAARRRAIYDGQDWLPGIGDPAIVCVIEEWQYLVATSIAAGDDKAVARFAAQVEAIATIARSVGLHLILVSQRGVSSVIPTNLTANLPTHVVGNVGDAELRLMFPTVEDIGLARVSRGARGRLALIGPGVVNHEDEPTQVHGLWTWQSGKPAPEIATLINSISARWGAPSAPPTPEEVPPASTDVATPTETATDAPSATDDDTETDSPRHPTQAEIKAMDALTAARLIVAWQAAERDPIKLSRATVHERIRALGFESVRDAVLLSALDRLSSVGVLEPAADPRFRRLAITSWPAVIERIRPDDAPKAD